MEGKSYGFTDGPDCACVDTVDIPEGHDTAEKCCYHDENTGAKQDTYQEFSVPR